MSELSIVFLGTGSINRRHARIVRKLRPRATLAVASRDADRAEAFRQQLGLREAFGSYQQAIQSSYRAVVVGVPPRAHFQLVDEILSAEKDALIEKPVFNSLSEFSQLWPRMVTHRGVLMVAENLHFAPFHRQLKRHLEQGDLGRPLYLDLTRLGRSHPKGWRADPAEMPLGALHEGGVHWIRRLLDLAAVFEEDHDPGVLGVRAYSPATPLTETPGEDTMIVVARHRSGLISRLVHSWAVPWRFFPWDSSKLVLEGGALYFDARGIIGRLYGRRKQMVWPRIRDAAGYVAMWRHYLECLDQRRSPDLSLQHIYDDFAYLDAAYRSVQSGREEPLQRSATSGG